MKSAMAAAGLGWEDLFPCLQHLVSVAVAVVRDDGQLVVCNDGFARLLRMDGHSPSDNIADFFILPRFRALAATAAEPGKAIHGGVLNFGNSSHECHSLIGSVHRDGPNLIVVAEFDVAEMEMLNARVVHLNEQLVEAQRELARQGRRLHRLTLTDPLTGLANRRRLEEVLLEQYERVGRFGESLSVVVADIDHFKRVNDRYGHDVGDEVLRQFAGLLRATVREIDLVARTGGEEFVVVMPMTGIDEAMASAQRMRAGTAKMRPASLPEGLTASFGVAQHRPGDTFASLLKHADEALYTAKNSGRNRVELYLRPASSQSAAPASAPDPAS